MAFLVGISGFSVKGNIFDLINEVKVFFFNSLNYTCLEFDSLYFFE